MLVLSVPPSPDAPHFVGQQNRLAVPFRAGAETEWMQEHDIERAYRTRFARQVAALESIDSMLTDVADRLDMTDRAWIVATATPHVPVPAVVPPPSRDDMRQIIGAAVGLAQRIGPAAGLERHLLVGEIDSSRARVGFRRWVVDSDSPGEPDSRSTTVHLELHHDGRLSFASAATGWFRHVSEDRHDFIPGLVQSFLIDLVALIDEAGRALSAEGPYGFRVVLGQAEDKPFGVVDNWRGGGWVTRDLEPARGSKSVRRFTPVDGEVSLGADPAALKAVARAAAADLLNQFGVSDLRILS